MSNSSDTLATDKNWGKMPKVLNPEDVVAAAKMYQIKAGISLKDSIHLSKVYPNYRGNLVYGQSSLGFLLRQSDPEDVHKMRIFKKRRLLV